LKKRTARKWRKSQRLMRVTQLFQSAGLPKEAWTERLLPNPVVRSEQSSVANI
jgi:hypothetical protein